MSDIIQSIFINKKVSLPKITSFGFVQEGSNYVYRKVLNESGFKLTVTIALDGRVSAEVIDPAFGEPYALHLIEGATGSFVGKIKSEYEEILTNIAINCFDIDVFKSACAKVVIEYVYNTYGNNLEFLWDKFPDNAIWRRNDTGKWYGALLTISKRKLGIKSDEIVEIIDLRIQPERLEVLIDNEKYYPGYHMNKKHWYTIILDFSVPIEEVCRRIDESYLLAEK